MRTSFSNRKLNRAHSSPLKIKIKGNKNKTKHSQNLSQKFKIIINRKLTQKSKPNQKPNKTERNSRIISFPSVKNSSFADIMDKKPKNSKNSLNALKPHKNRPRPRLNSHNSDLRDLNSTNNNHPKNLITIFTISPNEPSGSLRKCLLVKKLKIYLVKQLKFFDEDVSAIFRDFLRSWQKNINKDPYVMEIEGVFWEYPEGCTSVVMPNVYGYNLEVRIMLVVWRVVCF